MRRKYSTLLLVVYLLFTSTSILFSQERSKVLPYMPISSGQEEFNFERKIQLEVNYIKNCGYFGYLLQYVALRQDDLSVCRTADCRQYVESDLLFIRYQAEGKCNKIKDLLSKKVCEAIELNNCNQFAESKKGYCTGILNDDIDSLVKTVAIDNRIEEEVARAEVLHTLGIYWGFKHYNSVTACEKYMDQININNKSVPLVSQLACQILFYPDADRAFDEILRDIAIFSLSRKESRKDICEFIQNDKIKKACLSPDFKDLRDIFK